MESGISRVLGTRAPALSPDFWDWTAEQMWAGFTPEERRCCRGPAFSAWARYDADALRAAIANNTHPSLYLPWCQIALPPVPSTVDWPQYPQVTFTDTIPTSATRSNQIPLMRRTRGNIAYEVLGLLTRQLEVVDACPETCPPDLLPDLPACFGSAAVWHQLMRDHRTYSRALDTMSLLITMSNQSFGDLLAVLPDLRLPSWQLQSRRMGHLPSERRRPLSEARATALRATLDTVAPTWREAHALLMPIRAFLQMDAALTR
ncbi:MAG: hypothetical protein EBS05_23725 [Proteobacteria bacterium]|nr:hypothetical protein [Pseudomonadota bacterium]